jgi:hypothetical protein
VMDGCFSQMHIEDGSPLYVSISQVYVGID